MLLPLLLLLLKRAEVSNTVAGLFAATEWLGIFIVTPFASSITRAIGRRNALWIAAITPLLTACGFLLTEHVGLWFVLLLLGAMAGGMRWVLAEAFIAEFSPPQHRGTLIGAYATLIGMTMVIGPALVAWLGVDSPDGLWAVLAMLVVNVVPSHLFRRPPSAMYTTSLPVPSRNVAKYEVVLDDNAPVRSVHVHVVVLYVEVNSLPLHTASTGRVPSSFVHVKPPVIGCAANAADVRRVPPRLLMAP
jgi:MFS family permease